MQNLENCKKFDFINTFPPLGHPEHHFEKYPNHPWLRSKSDIMNWVKDHCIEGRLEFFIHDDLTVEFNKQHNEFSDIHVENNILDVIPVQFINAQSFYIHNQFIKTLIGTPYIVECLFASNNYIENFEGLSASALTYAGLSSNKIKDLSTLPKFKKDNVNINLSNNNVEEIDSITGKSVSIILKDNPLSNLNHLDLTNINQLSLFFGYQEDKHLISYWIKKLSKITFTGNLDKLEICISKKKLTHDVLGHSLFQKNKSEAINEIVDTKWLKKLFESKKMIKTIEQSISVEDLRKKRKL